MYTFVPNTTFGSLLEMSPANHIFVKTFNSEFQDIKVSFTDQNSQPLKIEDRINLTLVIKLTIRWVQLCWMQFHWMQFHWIKMRYSIEPRDKTHLKGYGFLSFAKNMGKLVSNKHGQKTSWYC